VSRNQSLVVKSQAHAFHLLAFNAKRKRMVNLIHRLMNYWSKNMQSNTQYNRIAVVLHWLMALMIVILLFIGSQILEPMANSNPDKLGPLQGHSIFGVITGLLLILRYLNIKLRGKPSPANAEGSKMNSIAKLAHRLIYVLVFAVIGSGIAMAVEADFASIFAGTTEMPESFNHLSTRSAHGILTKLLVFVLLAHIGAALYHQFIVKDHLLRRMRMKRFD
jgi:cytochrome b561